MHETPSKPDGQLGHPRAERAVVRMIADLICWRIDETETQTLLNLLVRPPKLNAAARRAAALAADVVVRS